MVDSLIKICHIIFFLVQFFFNPPQPWLVAGWQPLSHNSIQPSNLHQVIQPIDQINQIPRGAHGSSMVMFYIDSSPDLTLMDHFLFSLLLILHFYPPPPWIVAATLSQLHPTYIKSSNPLIKSTKYLRMLMDQVWSSFISTYHTTWLLRVRNVPTLC